MITWKVLDEPLQVGATKTLQFDTYIGDGDSRGDMITASSATVLVYDPNRPIEGTVDGGSTTTLGDTDVLNGYADDALIGIPVDVFGTNGTVADILTYESQITDNDQSASTITFPAMEHTPASGDTYRVRGTPRLSRTAATQSTNRTSYQFTSGNLTAYPGRFTVVFESTFASGDVEQYIYEVTVSQSKRRDAARRERR